MKRNLLLITFITAIISFSSCKQISKLTQFSMPYTDTITVPAASGFNVPFDLYTPDIETNSESTFSSYSTSADLIDKVSLSKLNLNLVSPKDKDFSFLKSIAVYISAEGLSDEKIAWIDDIPSSPGKSLTLSTSDTNLKDYVLKSKYKLRVQTVTNKLLTQDYKIETDIVFFVDANILGL